MKQVRGKTHAARFVTSIQWCFRMGPHVLYLVDCLQRHSRHHHCAGRFVDSFQNSALYGTKKRNANISEESFLRIRTGFKYTFSGTCTDREYWHNGCFFFVFSPFFVKCLSVLLGRSIWSDALRTWRNTRWRLQFTAKPPTCDTGITNTVNDFTFFHLLQVGQWVYYDDYWAHNFARNKKQQGIERFANCRGYPSQTGRDYVHNRNRNSFFLLKPCFSVFASEGVSEGEKCMSGVRDGNHTVTIYFKQRGLIRALAHTHTRATHTYISPLRLWNVMCRMSRSGRWRWHWTEWGSCSSKAPFLFLWSGTWPALTLGINATGGECAWVRRCFGWRSVVWSPL